MFRYGGDVKAKGVMHGMKNMQDGGPATMADATGLANGGMPNMRGRVTGPGGYAGEKPTENFYNNKTPQITGENKKIILESIVKKLGPGASEKDIALEYGKQTGTGGYKFSETAAAKGLEGIAAYGPNSLIAGGVDLAAVPLNTLGRMFGYNPGFSGTKLVDNLTGGRFSKFTGYDPETARFLGFKTSAKTGPTTDSSVIDDNISALLKDKKLVNGTVNFKKPKLTQAEIDAKTKADEDIKLKRIYKLLGVDSAQRNAASKALADVSRYIDEGGKDTISKKNIGSTLTKGILAFDKRLDKVDQLKEAAGLLLAKGEIAAMSDPLGKEIQKAQLDLTNQKLKPGVADSISNRRTIKKGALTEQETIDGVRSGAVNEGLELLGSITSDQIDDGNYKGKTVIDIVTDLKPEKDGYFVIGKSIIKVKSGVPKLIEGPLAID